MSTVFIQISLCYEDVLYAELHLCGSFRFAVLEGYNYFQVKAYTFSNKSKFSYVCFACNYGSVLLHALLFARHYTITKVFFTSCHFKSTLMYTQWVF